MRRGVLVFNPMSGRQTSRRQLPRVLAALAEAGFAAEPRPTSGPGDATRLARGAAQDGVEVVFAMGGDGTLREVATGILGSGSALGPLPAGTTNVLARALGLPRDARAAARAFAGAAVREIDVGLAGEMPFLMMASCGIDAAVMRDQDPRLKRRFGPAAMAFAAVRRLFTYGYPEIELRVAGRTARATLAVVANIPFYGGPFRMAPDADLHDRRLDLVLFRGRGRAATVGFARDLALGRHLGRPDVEVTKVERVEIVGPPELPIQIDGDVLPAGPPLEVRLAPERLRVLLP